jgi:hypothetical protein
MLSHTLDKDATNLRIKWSASMSYAHRTTTKNRAEYWSVVTGLREVGEEDGPWRLSGRAAWIFGSLQSTARSETSCCDHYSARPGGSQTK